MKKGYYNLSSFIFILHIYRKKEQIDKIVIKLKKVNRLPNEFLIKSNDTENGYIYVELNNRIQRLEKTVEELFNVIKLLNPNGINIEQLTNLAQNVESRAKLEYVQNHVEDSIRHLNDIKILEWDGKYQKPLGGIPESDLSPEVRAKLNK
jgi:hypothetical protein